MIQRGIMEWLAWRGVFVIRVNQQGVPLHDGSGGFRPSPTRGVSDILGVIPGGRFLAVEVKRPGNKATELQAEFLSHVIEKGGLGIVATCVGDVEVALRGHIGPDPETALGLPH